MLHFFRILRRRLLTSNKFSKYLLYAVGEIILVVIGILIALQIDNWNEERKQRETEIHYLNNLKTDLQLNIAELDDYIAYRSSEVEAATRVLEHFEGKPLINLVDFTYDIVNVYGWQRFNQQDNTFQELVNSGNLALISNDSIKNGLLNLQAAYTKLKNVELHGRYDSEILLYEPQYRILDLNTIHNILAFPDSTGLSYQNKTPSKAQYEALLKDLEHKNGFAMMRFEFNNHRGRLNRMKDQCYEIIGMIDRELEVEND